MGESILELAGACLLAHCSGALYWPDEELLVVADLHLEKGSSFASRGVLLPPYDTAATITRLAEVTTRFAPRLVVALGDSFHDNRGPARISDADRAALGALQRGRDWIWLAGNHDPEPVSDLGGISAKTLAVGQLNFRHAPQPGFVHGEIAGHLHPVARVPSRAGTLSRRCFACDGRRIIMPAFGAYVGGLNVRDRTFSAVFGIEFTAHVLGAARLYALAASRCLPD
jgi:DNA ligase-associated metallophosphoesterase